METARLIRNTLSVSEGCLQKRNVWNHLKFLLKRREKRGPFLSALKGNGPRLWREAVLSTQQWLWNVSSQPPEGHSEAPLSSVLASLLGSKTFNRQPDCHCASAQTCPETGDCLGSFPACDPSQQERNEKDQALWCMESVCRVSGALFLLKCLTKCIAGCILHSDQLEGLFPTLIFISLSDGIVRVRRT